MKRGLFKRSILLTTLLAALLTALVSWHGSGARAAAAADANTPTDAGDAVTDAPAKPVSEPAKPTTKFRSTGPAAEVVKMANSGVHEDVILTYVNLSSTVFNLSADEIIYLKDIGVSSSVISAMLKRDDEVRQELARANAAPQVAPATPVQSQPAETVATVPANSSDSLTAPALEVESGNFYESLAPYGSWVDVEGYGRCWQPTAARVSSDWRPYFDNGHWLYTDAGWYWMSDYSWGWAPFHYGRWFQHNHLGWCWLPDTTWAPSWVCWRYNDDYCGWAPLPPAAEFTASFGLTYHHRVAATGFDFGLSADFFPFVPWNHFRDNHLRPHLLPPPRAHEVFARTICASPIAQRNNMIVNHGVPPQRVASATHSPVQPISLHSAGTRPAGGKAEHLDPNGKSLTVYRPPMSSPGPRPSPYSPVQKNGPTPPPSSSPYSPVQAGRQTSGNNSGPGSPLAGNSGTRPNSGNNVAQEVTSRNPGTGLGNANSSRQSSSFGNTGHQAPSFGNNSSAASPSRPPAAVPSSSSQSTLPSRGDNNLIIRGQEVVATPARPARPVQTSSGNSLVVVGPRDYRRGMPEWPQSSPSVPSNAGVSANERPDFSRSSAFQAPTRSSPQEVPRYNSGPAYGSQPRSYSPLPQSYSAPSRPSAPIPEAPRYSAPQPQPRSGGDARPAASNSGNNNNNDRRRP